MTYNQNKKTYFRKDKTYSSRAYRNMARHDVYGKIRSSNAYRGNSRHLRDDYNGKE